MIDTPDAELGELGLLVKAWANSQRFPPTQREIARELGVSQQLVSNWMRGNYKASLKPAQLDAVARMMASAERGRTETYEDALTAMLRDLGLIPKVRARDAASTKRAR